MSWTYMELLTPTRHSAIVAKRWTVLGAICIIKQKNNILQCVNTYFPTFLFSFDMVRIEIVEKVLLTSHSRRVLCFCSAVNNCYPAKFL